MATRQMLLPRRCGIVSMSEIATEAIDDPDGEHVWVTSQLIFSKKPDQS